MPLPEMLAAIVRTKQRELADARERAPLADLRAEARDLPPPRDFLAAVAPGAARPAPEGTPPTGAPRRVEAVSTLPAIALIAEIKRASPSKGVMNDALDPAALAKAYASAGAVALSVLTDREFFRGSDADLRAARGAAPVPVLRKDFTIDPYQIWEARAMGADAVLLIARILSLRQMQDLGGLARELGLAVLFEVHNDQELPAVIDCRPRLVGVNSRDLDTFEVSFETCLRVGRTLPPGIGRVAESGIATREEVERAAACGYNAVLVGETIVRSADPAAKIRELLGAAPGAPPPFSTATSSDMKDLPPPPR
jgi:indole-3-glycerol phosphate synthase